jgi:hypothetical protein
VTGVLFALALASQVPTPKPPLESCLAVFGRCSFTGEELERLPHGGHIGSVLETLDPVAVTDRIDVGGIESASFALWGARGSSWSQNRVRLDGGDVTDPEGGRPLFYPQLEALEEISLATGARAAVAAAPGAELILTTRPAPMDFSGSALFRYAGRPLQSRNLNDRLVDLGVEPRELSSFPQGRLEVGGRHLYGSLYGFKLSSRVPHFPPLTEASLLSGTVKLQRGRFALLSLFQQLDQFHYGAAPRVAPAATLAARQGFQVAQARWTEPAFRIGFSLARASLTAPYSGGGTPRRDLARGEQADAPFFFGERRRTRVGLRADAERSFGRHRLLFGAEWSRGALDDSESVPGGLQRLFVDGEPHAVAVFTGPGKANLAIHRLDLHLEHAFNVGGRLHAVPGIHFDASRSKAIDWASVSPAISAELWLDEGGKTRIHGSFGRYAHALHSGWVAAAGGGLSSVLYRWLDSNKDGQFSAGELGAVLSRQGPAFSSIDPELPRPVTDELAVGISRRFDFGRLRVSGYHRREKNLLETVNVGVGKESYVPVLLDDVGIDGVAGTADDVRLRLFNQIAQFGEDRFLLTHPAGLDSFSQGVELAFLLQEGPITFSLSGRAYRDVGSAGPGNGAADNDAGRPGALFDDPNASANARGRLFFDRAFTAKSVFTFEAPRGFWIAGVTRYWDGQPFARFIELPHLGQGFTVVNAFPRGRLRYTYNLTLDLRIQRELRVGRIALTASLDVFNALNQALETEENARSGERFRETVAIQPARTLRGELRWRF